MATPYEIQARLHDRTSGLADKIGREIGLHSVALLSISGSGPGEELRFRGSGSLVSVENAGYVLTAAHVWKSFENAAGIGLTLDTEDVDHRFVMNVKSIVPYGPKNWDIGGPWGPDMRLLKIPLAPTEQLKKSKRFFLLTEATQLPSVNSLEVSILMGSPGEQNVGDTQHMDLTMNAIFATIRSSHSLDGYDYVDLAMDTTFPGIPNQFHGVSGAGLWNVSLYDSPNGEVRWISRLSGMACWQLPLVNSMRPVRCLGERSILSLISDLERSKRDGFE